MWLHVLRCDPEALQIAESALEAMDLDVDTLPDGDFSRDELLKLRDRVTETLVQRGTDPGPIALRWIHRDFRWRSIGELMDVDEPHAAQSRTVLVNVLDFLIATLGPRDYVRISRKGASIDE